MLGFLLEEFSKVILRRGASTFHLICSLCWDEIIFWQNSFREPSFSSWKISMAWSKERLL